MTARGLLIGTRLFFGLVTLLAVTIQLGIHIQNGFYVINFFSYFTNLSNIFAAVVLIVGAVYLLQHRDPTPTDDLIRGASVVGMAVVGIVFSLLLRDVELGALLPWINVVLHYIMPIVVVLDWLYQPARSPLTFPRTAVWLMFPFLYLVYSLIRGAVVGFYPYPFLNPAQTGGYGGVAGYGVMILVIFLGMGLLISSAANRLPRNVR